MPAAFRLAEIAGAKQRSRDRLAELEASSGLTRYAQRPTSFAEEILEIKLTAEQVQILESICQHAKTNVQAAHGVGKSLVAAIAVLWWVFCVRGLAISTAPTLAQVEQILWSEIRSLYDRHATKLGGSRNELSVKLTEKARAYGFASKNYDSNSFQGKHAERLLLIQDEACGITEEIDDGFDSCLTGSENRGLRIGNPIQTNTPFQRACARNHIRIAAWSHPNIAWAYELGEDGTHHLKPDIAAQILKPECDRGDDPVRPQSEWPPELPRDVIPGAISINWIESVRVKKGQSSRFWQTRVEGLFAIDSQSSIVPRSWFEAARARYDADPAGWDAQAAPHPNRQGLDVGDGGDDHARARWRGPVLYATVTYPTQGDRQDVPRAAGIAARKLAEHGGSIHVDRVGVGAGALGALLDQGQDAHGVSWGEAAADSAIFANSKAEDFWNLREAFRKGEVAIAPLGAAEDELAEDLAGIYYEETSTGKIRIEDKEKTRKRLHRSPNAADAVCMAFRIPPVPVFAITEASWGY